MAWRILGVGDHALSHCPADTLATYALGSCVALVLIGKSGAGLAHVALPDSQINPEKANYRPGYFADTAVPALLTPFLNREASQGLKVFLVGGADAPNAHDLFCLGRKNLDRIQRELEGYGLRVQGQEVGGNRTRTVKLDVGNKVLYLSSPGLPNRKLG